MTAANGTLADAGQVAGGPPGRNAVLAVLTWRGEATTRRCLASLTRLDGWPLPTLVVDNGSGTGEGERLAAEFGEFVSASVRSVNDGVPGGYNAALRWGLQRGASHVLLLNNDIVVEDAGMVGSLLAAAAADVAAVGPIVRDVDGSVFSAGGLIDWPLGRTRHRRRPIREDSPYEVEWLDGPCLLVSLDAVRRIGGLAPEFFMYSEELDWCTRAGRAGFRIVVEPRAAVIHERGTRRPSMQVRELSLRNAILFMRRNGGVRQNLTSLAWSLIYRPLAMAARCVTRPADFVRVPGVVVRAVAWNVSDAISRRGWRIPAEGPDLTSG
ncbi:MAG: glycosyltransferase family 2 protein [Chloroflexi bacterium]|nr:glycosyltransferase family 2 protein [Chloroflexota bacterium]